LLKCGKIGTFQRVMILLVFDFTEIQLIPAGRTYKTTYDNVAKERAKPDTRLSM